MRTLPSALPNRLLTVPKLRAERKVFDALKRVDFEKGATAVHSLRLSEHEYKREGEIDFVIVAPSGLFVLEVKGGGVYRDGHGVWHFTDRWGNDHRRHEGPFDQARSGMYALRDALFDHFGRDLRKQLTYGFGVITPDARLSAPTPEWDARELLDKDGFRTDADLDRFLRTLRDYNQEKTSKRQQLSHKWIGRIVEFLRPRFDLVPSLIRHIDEVREAQESLTREQYAYLDAASDNPRVLCIGGAGTGKTFLALEVARRDASTGRAVLLTCRSAALSAFLRKRLNGEAGVSIVPAERLPEFDKAEFDTAVVDEGQDLLTLPFLTALDERLNGGLDDGRWRFFYDSNRQSGFYGEPDPAALEILQQAHPARIRLTRNCRNPLPIVRQTRVYTGGDLGLPASGGGPEVDLLYAKDATDAVGKLQLRLRELFRDGIEPGAVSILSPRPFKEASAAELPEDLRRRIRPLDAATASDFPFTALSFASIVDFKGFENDVVIVTDIDEARLHPTAENVFYVAMSRARVRLVMILPEDMRPVMNELAATHLPALLEAEQRSA